MKALILSGGRGTRLRPITHTGAKQLLPVANKPILWYCIESIVAMGITDIGIIISPETGPEIRKRTGTGERFGANITYLLQDQPLGLAHAVKVARPFLQDVPFLMYLGDNLIGDELVSWTSKFKQKNLDALILLHQVLDPRPFGVAEVTEDGRVTRLVEKPQNPSSNLALVGVYFFSPAIHDVIANLEFSPRGELEITAAIQMLINDQKQVEAEYLKSWWVDTGRKDDLLKANCVVLDAYQPSDCLGEVDAQTRIDGRVQIGAGSRLINCRIRGPVIIGENCQLTNSFIGPYSSIGDQVILTDADLDHSVLLQGARIEGIQHRIVDSLVGQRVKLTAAPRQPKALRFMVGDDSHIELN